MTNDAIKLYRIQELADVRPGHPFRGAIKDSQSGEIPVVQLKNASPEKGVDWEGLVRTNIEGRKQPDWLSPGDVLFSARGARNEAVHLNEVPGQAICAPQFFLLRVKKGKVLPSYLAWYLNEGPAQKYFAQSAEGSVITSIRRAVLENLEIPVPPVERQELIVKLNETAMREKQLMSELIENREKQLKLVARSLIK